MSDERNSQNTPPALTDPITLTDVVAPSQAARNLSAGQLLRQAREASGLHVANLAMALKVPVKKIEALESDDWANLPDAVFVRALATSICRQIKTDPKPILEAMPKMAAPVLLSTPQMGLNQAFPSNHPQGWQAWQIKVSSKSLLLTVVVLLAALVVLWWPSKQDGMDAKTQDKLVTEAVVPQFQTPLLAESAPATKMAEATVLTPAPSNTAKREDVPALPVTPAASVSSAPVSAPAPAPAPALNHLAVPSSAAGGAAPNMAKSMVPFAPRYPANNDLTANKATPTGNAVLRMTSKGVVWVEVKDSKGVILLQRTLQPKEVVNATGSPPLSVVVGRVNEMQSIEVRGKPFSLAGLSPDNVARFEVK